MPHKETVQLKNLRLAICCPPVRCYGRIPEKLVDANAGVAAATTG
jgi:hypothetical protein